MIVRLADLPVPANPAHLFGREGPLVVEVGFGNGGFLEELSRQRPDWNLLGVEKAMASVSRSYVRLHDASVTTVRLLHARAEWALREVTPPRSLRRVYVNFPDPWPKSSHRSRRLMQQPFLRMVATRLADDGDLLFTSDHEEYFAFAMRQAEQSELFDVEPREPSADFLATKYAQRWLSMSKRIQQMILRKRAEPDEAFPAQLEVVPVQHILMEGSLDGIAEFRRQSIPHGEGAIVLSDLLRSVDGERLEFLVHANGHGLQQELMIEARRSANGVTVELQNFGDPIVTRQVRDCVRIVADWLVERGLKIVKEAV